MRNGTREEILEYVLGTLQEISKDWDYSRHVGPDSRLFSELGLESLDAVILGTVIQEHFQKQMPFGEMLAEIGRQRRDLSIMQLVDFVDQHLNSDPVAAGRTAKLQ